MAVLVNSDGLYMGSSPRYVGGWCVVNDSIHIPLEVADTYTQMEVSDPVVLQVGGFRWSGSDWEDIREDTPQPEPVPQTLTARQARLALHSIGKLTDVPAAIAALPEPQKTNAEIEWEYATHIERNNPFVAVLASALQLTDDQVDHLFIEGVKL